MAASRTKADTKKPYWEDIHALSDASFWENILEAQGLIADALIRAKAMQGIYMPAETRKRLKTSTETLLMALDL